MSLSKKQKEERIHLWVVATICFGAIALTFTFMLSSESKPDQELDSGTKSLMNSDSLEIANPIYLEKYFETWQE